MKKRILPILLAVCLAAGSVAIPREVCAASAGIERDVKAAERDAQEWEYEELGDGTVAVTKYSGTATEVMIPATLGGKQVSAIGSEETKRGLFEYDRTVTKVTIPEGVKSIRAEAFTYSYGLVQVNIPGSVTTIGDFAFNNCVSLASVRLSEGVTDIGNSAFGGCKSLGGVTLPESLTSIGENAFYGCSAYDSVTGRPTGLAGISIPAKVAHIGEGAFCNNANLSKIEVAQGNTTYTSVDGALLNKAKTELLAYPAGKQLSRYVVPDGVQKIGEAVFGWSSISEVVLPSSLKEIGKYAFFETHIKTVTLPKGLTTIGERAFRCSIKEITIPAAATSIAEDAFCWNDYLAAIYVDAANTAYASVDGVLYNKARTELLQYPVNKKGTGFAIPDGVTAVGSFAFYRAGNLNSIIVPKHVTGLKGEVFNSSRIREVTVLNPQCVFDERDYVFDSRAKIRGYAGSTAQEYAEAKGNEFEVIPDACTQHSYIEQVAKAATCTEKGEKKYTCKNCGHSYTGEIPQAGHTNTTETSPAAPGKNGSSVTKCSVCGKVSGSRTIAAPKSVTLSKTSLTYNGKAQKVTVKVKDSAGKAISASDYSVSFGSNKNVGEATVTVTFDGDDYTGSMKKTFSILPKGTTLSKVTGLKKGFTAKWKKQASQTDGYEIQYSTSSKFKGAKTVGNIKPGVTSKNISKLKAKKKYYVRIRTYKTAKVGGKNKKLYSGWSKAKTVTTKK